MVFAMGLPSWGEALSDDVIRRFLGSIGLRKTLPVQLGLDYSIESTYDIFFQRFSSKRLKAEVSDGCDRARKRLLGWGAIGPNLTQQPMRKKTNFCSYIESDKYQTNTSSQHK
jgi:hypothetical protein